MPFSEATELPPGTYFLLFEAPDAILDAMARHPSWSQRAQAVLVAQGLPGVRFEGGGPTWAPIDGGMRRVYSMRITVPEARPPTGGPPVHAEGFAAAGIGPVVVVTLGAVLAALLIALVYRSTVLEVWRMVPEDERGDVIRDLNPFPAVRDSTMWLALAVVGAAVIVWRWRS